MATKLGKSETDGEIKKEKVLKVYWKLHLKPQHQKKQVQGSLQMPTNLSSKYKGGGICPPVVLELFNEHEVKPADGKSDQDRKEKVYVDKVHALQVMRGSAASSILHARLVLDGKCPLLHCVEPYDGNLADYLVSKNLGISEFTDPEDTVVLPTFNLSSAFSQVIDGMRQLIISGKYHGNFSLKNTLYIINEKAELKLKLSGFRKKTVGSRKEILAADWYSVADGLVEIRELARKLNVTSNTLPRISTCQLDGLISCLRDIGSYNADVAFESIKKQPFFWGKPERKVFYIYTIPLALKKPKFVFDVKRANIIDLPWGEGGFDGYLKIMNTYRRDHGLEEYDTKCAKSFVKFISGLYTHEEEIKALLRVDVAVQKRHPELCYKLYALLPGPLRT